MQTLVDGRLLFITNDYNLFFYEFIHLVQLKKQIESELFNSIDDACSQPALTGKLPPVLSRIVSKYAMDFPALFSFKVASENLKTADTTKSTSLTESALTHKKPGM